MAAKPRNKMPVADRAKQFMPFAALKGLPEALLRKEYDVTLQYEPQYLEYDEGCEPGDNALADYDCDSPFAAQLPPD